MSNVPWKMPPRVVSLLPSATEKLALIGGLKLLVGRSHECDYPPDAASVPILTASRLTFESSKQIDHDVSKALSEGKGLYTLDAEKLQALKPDIIITQDICSVCSIDMVVVQRIAKKLVPEPVVVSLNPAGLNDMLADILRVGDAVGLGEQARRVHDDLRKRIDKGLASAAEAASLRARRGKGSPKVAFLEWTDPAYVGGHWTPEMIAMAGGSHPLNPAGSDPSGGAGKSFAVHPDQIVETDPDIVIWSPCGLDLDATETEVARMLDAPGGEWFLGLRAVKKGRVAVVDGNQMFNRPGPRLVDAFEWLVWYINGGADGASPPPHLADFPWRKWVAPAPSRAQAPVNGLASKVSASSAPSGTRDALCSPAGGFPPDIEDAHRAAVRQGKDMYTDPATGYMVFTEEAARKRGYCCGRGCRHCPYGHWNVEEKALQKNMVRKAVFLKHGKNKEAMQKGGPLDVLFWSGGKDSFMALKKLEKDNGQRASDCVLFTTYNGSTGILPEQNIHTRKVMDQAKALGLSLMLVPLPADSCGNDEYVATVGASLDQLLAELGRSNSRQDVTLVFGDLHLQDIKEWREKCLGPESTLKYHLKFPLFGMPYADLRHLLFDGPRPIKVHIAAVSETGAAKGMLQVGQEFNAGLIERLQSDGRVDAFGECGEFHTEVVFV